MVAFVYVPDKDGQLVANGTAFFVSVPSEKAGAQPFRYLVTAKHVLTNINTGTWYPKVSIRLNKIASGTDAVPVVISPEGSHKNVFIDSDPTVDLAVMEVPSSIAKDDVVALPVDQVTSKDGIQKLRVSEGTDVFFVGMYVAHVGEQKNYPIVRFGHIALLSDEKISWNGVMKDLYLVDSASYGGNSGSPVFLYYQTIHVDGGVSIDLENLSLAGVMMGTYLDSLRLDIVETDTSATAVNRASNGISAVTPAYRLRDILFSLELAERRQKWTLYSVH